MDMKKLLLLFLVLTSFSLVSADANKPTIVGGQITDSSGFPVQYANVEVICNGTPKYTQSGIYTLEEFKAMAKSAPELRDYFDGQNVDISGIYVVSFTSTECGINDKVTVNAVKDDVHGSMDGTVADSVCWYNFAIINVPLVPEFGVVVGMLTMISAIGIFFVVRKD